jgi:phytoene/squalene synthetase
MLYRYRDSREPEDLYLLGDKYNHFLDLIGDYSPTYAAKKAGFVWQCWRRAILADNKDVLKEYLEKLNKKRQGIK